MIYPSDIQFYLGTNAPYAVPNAGTILLYAKTDGNFYSLNSTGVETLLLSSGSGGGGGGGPTYTPGAGIGISGTTLSNTGILSVAGTANQINASTVSGATTLSLPTNVTISGTMTAAAFAGSGASLTGTAPSLSIGGTAALATNVAGGAANQIHYQTGANTTGFIPTANYGVLTTNSAGAPSVIAGAAGVLVGSTSTVPVFTTSPTLTGTNFTGIPVAALTSSVINLGSSSITLGAAATTALSGLTSVSATTLTGNHTGTGAFTTLSASGQITSTVATGTAPFVVASTTPVANLSIGGNAATATLANSATTAGTAGTVTTAAQPAITSLGTQAANLNMGSNLVNNLGTPLVGTDAVNKSYVDTNFVKNLVGTFATTAALPAVGTVPNGAIALVGSAAPYAVYQNNGSAWVGNLTATINGGGAVTAINGPNGQIMAVDPVTGDLVVNIVPRTGLLGTASTGLLSLQGAAGELASATDIAAIVQYTGVAGQAKAFYATPTYLVPAVITATPANNTPGILLANATYTCGVHFTSLATALTFFANCSAAPGVEITLQLAKGPNVGTTPGKAIPWLIIQGWQDVNAGWVGALGTYEGGVPFTAATISGTTDTTRTITFTIGTTLVNSIIALNGTGVNIPIGVIGITAATNVTALNGVTLIRSVNSAAGTITCDYHIPTNSGAWLPTGPMDGNLSILNSWITGYFDLSSVGGVYQVGFYGNSIPITVGTYANYNFVYLADIIVHGYVQMNVPSSPAQIYISGEFMVCSMYCEGDNRTVIDFSGYSGDNLAPTIGSLSNSVIRQFIIKGIQLFSPNFGFSLIAISLYVTNGGYVLCTNGGGGLTVTNLVGPYYTYAYATSRAIFGAAAVLTNVTPGQSTLPAKNVMAADGSIILSP